MANRIETAVENLAGEIIKNFPALELVDVEFVKERDWFLRVYIDKEGGVDLDDCQEFSEKLGAALDKADVIDEQYILEVSSPGLDRVLKKPRDFIREKGKSVEVKFYAPLDGQKSIVGVLEGADDQSLKLEGREPLPLKSIAQIRLHIEF